jgi:hypothetical protein
MGHTSCYLLIVSGADNDRDYTPLATPGKCAVRPASRRHVGVHPEFDVVGELLCMAMNTQESAISCG